ncbi:MAG TPA: hypothetical protein VFM65_02730 [Flavobacteriaceae bacterium]|nr:hypothetical protein [Flavobacteriaceae bacterium]
MSYKYFWFGKKWVRVYLLFVFLLSCKAQKVENCPDTDKYLKFDSFSEMVKYTENEKNKIGVVVLNGIIVTKDSINILLKKWKNYKIISVEDIKGPSGEGNLMTVIAIEACYKK